ncbi:hypothetical protein LCGC14_0560250 [marine sediment metagenome]|uniref:Uncharacterized protein n=1 Tax=marine sediment metagenome TaxID=412755 RepID=A0A0F9UVI6_9ZZZZ
MKNPIQKNIDKVIELFDDRNNFIVIYTTRSRYIREETKELLNKFNIPYHALVMEKIRADVYIDDKNEIW